VARIVTSAASEGGHADLTAFVEQVAVAGVEQLDADLTAFVEQVAVAGVEQLDSDARRAGHVEWVVVARSPNG
jgi:hypothetical protein